MSVAVIGTNEFEAHEVGLQHVYLTAIARLALARIPIRTGASRGCDQVAAQAALEVGGRVELVLPWPDFEAGWVRAMCRKHSGRCTIEVFDPARHPEWLASVRRYQRRGEALNEETCRLYARVFGIVRPAELVLSMPLTSALMGGTGQGIRIGHALGKVVLDIRKAEDRERLYGWLKGLPH